MAGIRGVPWVTSGSQKWRGAIPIFITRAISIIVDRVWLWGGLIVHCPEVRLLRKMAIRRIIDAVAWIRKYLVEASVDRGFVFLAKIGTMASMFSSRPIQARNQCELRIVIVVPVRMVREIIRWARGLILVREGFNQHFRGMGPIAYLADLTV